MNNKLSEKELCHLVRKYGKDEAGNVEVDSLNLFYGEFAKLSGKPVTNLFIGRRGIKECCISKRKIFTLAPFKVNAVN